MQVVISKWPQQCEDLAMYQVIAKGRSHIIDFGQELVSFSIDLELRHNSDRFNNLRFIVIEFAEATFRFDPIFINPVGKSCLAIKGTRELTDAQRLRNRNMMYDLYHGFYVYGMAGNGSRIDISTKSDESINYDIVFNIVNRADC